MISRCSSSGFSSISVSGSDIISSWSSFSAAEEANGSSSSESEFEVRAAEGREKAVEVEVRGFDVVGLESFLVVVDFALGGFLVVVVGRGGLKGLGGIMMLDCIARKIAVDLWKAWSCTCALD